MKKEYEAPKAEKMEFNYSEAVVASGTCDWEKIKTQSYEGCEETTSKPSYPISTVA